MQHTYFFQTLHWSAEGTYFENDRSIPLTGEADIVRKEAEWTIGGFMEIKTEPSVRFQNCYQIHRSDEETTLEWESFNPALGTLRGTFEIIGDSIISFYTSEDGVYSGTETLTQQDEATYYNVGVSFHNGKKMSSWTALLKAKK